MMPNVAMPPPAIDAEMQAPILAGYARSFYNEFSGRRAGAEVGDRDRDARVLVDAGSVAEVDDGDADLPVGRVEDVCPVLGASHPGGESALDAERLRCPEDVL